MGASTLTSRAIIGAFYSQLQIDDAQRWAGPVSMLFESDQSSEEYNWIGQTPAMREWVGGRHAKGFRENGIEIKNKHFEATIEILSREIRRDKTGQVMTRIRELAQRTNSHWASLLSTLIINGESSACYDGQYFFDIDHSEGDSGTQSNIVSVDISALPTASHGTTTAPSVEEVQQAILKGITQIQSFVDDQGEPMNEAANSFIIMPPPALNFVTMNAVGMPAGTGLTQQGVPVGIQATVVPNPRLNAWTDKFAIFRTDGNVKPFIRQQETAVSFKSKAEGSEFEFDNDAHQYGVDTWRNVGYGYWQHACLVKMV